MKIAVFGAAGRTGTGVRFPVDKPRLPDRVIRGLLRLLQPQVLADSTAYARRIAESDLEWTIVRAPMLHDGPGAEAYRVGHVGTGPGARASRTTVARFLLDLLEAHSHIRDVPMISD